MNIIGIDTRQLRGSQRNESFRAQESKHAEHCSRPEDSISTVS
jgi:hypothetical protein